MVVHFEADLARHILQQNVSIHYLVFRQVYPNKMYISKLFFLTLVSKSLLFSISERDLEFAPYGSRPRYALEVSSFIML